MKRLLFFISLLPYYLFSQQWKKIDFISCDAKIAPNYIEKSISGSVDFKCNIKKIIDSIRIDAKNMNVNHVFINQKEVRFRNSGTEIILYEGFKKGNNRILFDFYAKPKQTMYFIGNFSNVKNQNGQVWTQGQGKYTSFWLPSFDDVNEKLIFNLSIHDTYEFENINSFQKIILANGILKKVVKRKSWSMGEEFITYSYEMKKPMSSYLVMLAIGDFIKKEEQSAKGTTLEFYLNSSDYDKWEPTYRYSKKIFDYLEREIGIPYPWGIYRQIPVRDFLYAGMENTTSTIFSQDFVVDSIGFNDRNYINVNAHELAHQWFGNLVTAATGKHHWLQEGFATYYALLAERELFGEDYFYEQLNDYAFQLQQASAYDSVPVLSEKASSLTYYKKGAWALHVLREDIGPKKFQKIVKKYLKKFAYKNVTTSDFLKWVTKYSSYDVTSFQKTWLEQTNFPMAVAETYLAKNLHIKEFQNIRNRNFTISDYEKIMLSNSYYTIKAYILYRLEQIPFEQKKRLIELALDSKDYRIRQAVAETITDIPLEFQSKYASLLNDDSYQTKEIALVNLCKNFPNDIHKYLELTKNYTGTNDKSFQCRWLDLALKNEKYSTIEKEAFWNKLRTLASDSYESSIRQNALEILLEHNPYDADVITLLFQATSHHKWQFTKFAREQIRTYLKQTEYRKKVTELMLLAPIELKKIYQKFLEEK